MDGYQKKFNKKAMKLRENKSKYQQLVWWREKEKSINHLRMEYVRTIKILKMFSQQKTD